MSIPACENFLPLAERYDAFLLDLWGVVHDGTALYPGARECLQQLHALQKKVVMISNAPRRATKAQSVLDALAVERSWYKAVITSGETAYQELAAGNVSVGRHYYFIGPERDADALDGLDYVRVAEVGQADFLLNVGFGSEQDTVADVHDILMSAAARNLPMLCLNPDMEVVKITGERFECAGVIAKQYEGVGGIVHYYGKPYGGIYERAYMLLGEPPKEKILAVGDGLFTDILGANRFGVDSVLITGGILKDRLPESVAGQIQPRYIMSIWIW